MTQDEYQKVLKKFQNSYMSNAKWRKLFVALANFGNIEYSEWKLVDNPAPQVKRFPKKTELMEKRFADGYFQPFEYKWIEWIKVPAVYRLHEHVDLEKSNDLDQIFRTIEAIGLFEIEKTSEYLKIYAYK